MLYYIFIGLLTPFFDAIGNIIDSKMARSLSLNSIIFYGTILNLLFMPVIFIFGLPKVPDMNALLMIIIGGLVQVLYLYPYTMALKHIDTSIVAALFSIGKLFIPIFAFFIANEKLSLNVYIGFFIVVFASIFLSMSRTEGKFHISKAFVYMFICSVILSMNNILTKYIFNINTDWVTYFFFSQGVSFAFVILLLAIKKYRTDVLTDFMECRKHLGKFILQSGVAVGGIASMIFAIYLTPVTFATGIESTQPLIVLGLSFIIHKIRPDFLYEGMGIDSVMKKIGFFACMIFGVVLMTKGF